MYLPPGANPQLPFQFPAPSYPHLEAQLQEAIAYLEPQERQFLLERVYPYANFWHQRQSPRANGQPYISHPVAVAAILSPYYLDLGSMAAAILHDVHEDNEEAVRLEDIEAYFGTEIRNLVDGLTKIGKASARQRREAAQAAVCEASFSLAASMQATLGLTVNSGLASPLTPSQIRERARQAKLDDKAASLIKLVNEMSRDIRVIIIKLADRLHNMRTLSGLRPDKQVRIAQETLNFFAPLATRLGMWTFKTELEDLCFLYLEPKIYESLADDLERVRSQRSADVQATLEAVQEALASEKVEAKVTLRTKHLYSILCKMRRQHKELEQIFDLDPISVVASDKNACYQALRLIHQRFGFLQGKFRDYIANPKSNNYQALHTTVPGINRQPVEIQICTKEEDADDRLGVLNVFLSGRYRREAQAGGADRLFRPFAPWLASLNHIKEGTDGNQDFLDVLCQDELNVGIVCSTPGGQRIELPQGSTPLDFAFKVHSKLGLRCTGAIVNDREVSLTNYELRENDVVQIITSQVDAPSRSWYNHCRTRLARQRLSKWFMAHDSPEPNRSIGYKLVCAELIRQGAAGTQNNAEIMRSLSQSLGCQSIDDLYVALGSCRVTPSAFAKTLQKYRETNPQEFDNLSANPQRLRDISLSVRIQDHPEARVFACRRCTPVCGDAIKATRGLKNKGFFIHRLTCPYVLNAPLDGVELYGAEWIAGVDPQLFMLRSTVLIMALVRHGLSNSIIGVFDSRNVLIYNYQFNNDYARNVSTIRIEVGAASVQELELLMDALRLVDSVVTVERL